MDKIKVEVVYAKPETQRLISLELDLKDSIEDAIKKSGLLSEFPEINLNTNKIGIHGKAVRKPEEHNLREGDRIEIYRPLIKKS